ncbi:MAG TPA: hypothetical protein VMZ52_06435 [Bryobacteraceae bacterium]|nr:hypothetical protein [Bryobacteraceae bacterium]
MTPAEIRSLLGGYATGTLTPAEQQALYAAALEDDQLFAALSDEHALRELLEDPAARGKLLAALEKRPLSIWTILRRPGSLALIGTAAVIAVAVGITTLRPAHNEFAQVRVNSLPAAAPAMEAAPAPEPKEVSKSVAASTAAPAMKSGNRPLSAALRAPVSQPEEAPATAQVAAPPPAITSGAVAEAAKFASAADLSKVAVSNAASLRYSLLQQAPTGAYVPVALGSSFQDEDMLRLKVESSEEGTLQLRQGAATLFTGSIPGGVPTVIPQEGAIQPKAGSLRLVFSAQRAALSNTLLPHAIPSRAKAKAAAADSAAPVAPLSAETISVDIKLR